MFKKFLGLIVASYVITPATQTKTGSAIIALAEGCYLAYEFEHAFKKAKADTLTLDNSTSCTMDADGKVIQRGKDQVVPRYPKLTRLEFAKRPDLIKKYLRTKHVGASLLATVGGITYLELFKKQAPTRQQRNNAARPFDSDQSAHRQQSTGVPFRTTPDLDSDDESSSESDLEPLSDFERFVAEQNAQIAPGETITFATFEQPLQQLARTQTPEERQTKIVEFQALCTKHIIETDFLKLSDLNRLQQAHPQYGGILADLIELRSNPNMLERARYFIVTDCKRPFNIRMCGTVQNYAFKKLVIEGNVLDVLVIETSTQFESQILYKNINKPIKGWFGRTIDHEYSCRALKHLEKKNWLGKELDMTLEGFIEHLEHGTKLQASAPSGEEDDY